MKVNLTKSPPIVYQKGNAALCRNGNVIVGYKCSLQESYTLGESDNERIIDSVEGAFKGFDGNVLVHKMDVFLEKPVRFEKEYKEGGGWLRQKFVEHHEKRTYLEQESYVFYVWSMSEVIGKDFIGNPFMSFKKREQAIIDELEDTDFLSAVTRSVNYVKNSKTFSLEALDDGHMGKIAEAHFMGYQGGSDVDIEKTPEGGLAVGGKEVDMFVIGSLLQFPDEVNSVIPNKKFSDKDSTFYEGLMDGFGVNLQCDHVVNQIIYFPKHEKLVDEIKKKQEDFYGTRTEGYYGDNAKQLSEYLKELSERAGEKLVRTHFNVIIYGTSKEIKNFRKDTEAIFDERSLKPYRPTGKRLWGMYASSFFGFSSGIPKRYAFLTKLEQAANLWLRTGGYKSDEEGLYFFDRDQLKPFKRDLWDDDNKRVKARNFMIIADTGEGKSSAGQHIVYQKLDEGEKVVVNDLGKSFQNMTRLYGDRAAMFEFEEGKPLGLNPFKIESESDLTSSFINETVDFINLLTFKSLAEDTVEEESKISMRKVVSGFYNAIDSGQNVETFHKFLKYLKKNKDVMESIGVDPSRIDIGTYEYAMQEYVGDGIYSFLFKESESAFDIEGKDFLVYELANALSDPLMLSILMGFSYQGTKKIIWEDRSVRGNLLFEEFAKTIKVPTVVDTAEYYAQAIRKQNGSVGFVLQNVSQIPETGTAKSILGSTQIFHLFPGDHTETINRLNLSGHRAYMLNSLKSDFKCDEPYTEILQLYGKKFENVVRINLPREHYYAFQTEGRFYKQIEKYYEKGRSMESIVEAMVKNYG